MITALAIVLCIFCHSAASQDSISTQPNALAESTNLDELPVATSSQDASQQISYGIEQFSTEFIKLLSKAVTSFNYDFIVSPFSIWSLLVLQAEGADGNTYQQLQQVLRLPNDLSHLRRSYKQIQKSMNVNTSMVEVSANQVLFSDLNRPVDPDFAYKLENVYAADHMSINFHNRFDSYNKINQYVDDKTHGRIRKIVNMDDLKEAQMLMISALFFKGNWKVNTFQTIFCSIQKN